MTDASRTNAGFSLSSASLLEHLIRGAIGFAAIYFSIVIARSDGTSWGTVASLGLGIAALVMFRGCPACWTVGLVMTLGDLVRRAKPLGLRGAKRHVETKFPQ